MTLEPTERRSGPGLRERIADEIARNGPIPFSRYMELCLFESELGYYSRSRSSTNTSSRPCLAYTNSTLASKSDGACYNTISKEKRCFRYSSRHKYIEIKSSKARKLAY